MSRVRACLPCRTAKAQCDPARPKCGRCAHQGLICSGLPLEDVFVFRDENEVAKRNSQRARREQKISARSSTSKSQDKQSQTVVDVADIVLQLQYSWLKEHALADVPGPLKRGIETRAVERFFINWTLHPNNHGGSPGHMHELPMLFDTAQSDSALKHAVRAVAFADMRNQSTGDVSFYIKARQQYGAALNSVRAILNGQNDLANDRVLYALLLIDNFELMYLARNDPLGPHSGAIRHVLRSRGDAQLYSPTRFSLWRLTHYRLQSWQTLFQEQPDAQQIAWVSKLNLERPDLRICSHVLHMNILSAVAKTMTQTATDAEEMRISRLNQVDLVIREMRGLTVTVESFMSEMRGVWKAKIDDPSKIVQPRDVDELADFPIPQFPYQRLLSYDDIWLAYIWNFYVASQIVLRESLISIIEYASKLRGQNEPDDESTAATQKQRDWVEVLSAAIIESFPQLLGFMNERKEGGLQRLPQQGRMAGRLFALFSMWVIQRSQFASAQHKQTASEVVSWVNARHGLD